MVCSYRIKSLVIIGTVIALYVILSCYNSDIRSLLHKYAIKQAERTLGSLPVAPEIEAKFLALAKKIDFHEPVIIRKMNVRGLQHYGYCNAVSYFPLFLNLIPYSTQGFIFVSVGFLETLSDQEQEFLIAHELVHLKERHVLYQFLIGYIIILLAGIFVWFYLYKKSKNKYISLMIFFFMLIGIHLGELAYARAIEWDADRQALQALKCYDGALALIDRWQREYHVPEHNLYGGWLSRHPSCAERRSYFLSLQNCKDSYEQA